MNTGRPKNGSRDQVGTHSNFITDPEEGTIVGAGILVPLYDNDKRVGAVCASFEGREHEIDAHHLARSDLFS
jgi:hypothetical protein